MRITNRIRQTSKPKQKADRDKASATGELDPKWIEWARPYATGVFPKPAKVWSPQ